MRSFQEKQFECLEKKFEKHITVTKPYYQALRSKEKVKK
jgi:hypothetical protein